MLLCICIFIDTVNTIYTGRCCAHWRRQEWRGSYNKSSQLVSGARARMRANYQRRERRPSIRSPRRKPGPRNVSVLMNAFRSCDVICVTHRLSRAFGRHTPLDAGFRRQERGRKARKPTTRRRCVRGQELQRAQTQTHHPITPAKAGAQECWCADDFRRM